MNKTAEKALGTYIKLMRATEAVTSKAHRHLAQNNLTTSQFAVLELLYHKGPQHQSDIARKILKSCGNITTVIDNLERRRLVTRERRSCDRRFVTVRLTDNGEGLIAEVFPRHAEAISAAMSCLNQQELEQLGNLCRCLGKGLESHSGRKDAAS